jgi:hypothetical protein
MRAILHGYSPDLPCSMLDIEADTYGRHRSSKSKETEIISLYFFSDVSFYLMRSEVKFAILSSGYPTRCRV